MHRTFLRLLVMVLLLGGVYSAVHATTTTLRRVRLDQGLWAAAAAGDLAGMKRNLDGGADPNAAYPTKLGTNTAPERIVTALGMAVHQADQSAVSLLLARGADPNRWGTGRWMRDRWATCLDYLILSPWPPAHRMAETLVSAGGRVTPAEPDAGDLLQACVRGDTRRVRDLVSKVPSNSIAVDLHARDTGGRTPLQWAEWMGHREIARLLRDAGANH